MRTRWCYPPSPRLVAPTVVLPHRHAPSRIAISRGISRSTATGYPAAIQPARQRLRYDLWTKLDIWQQPSDRTRHDSIDKSTCKRRNGELFCSHFNHLAHLTCKNASKLQCQAPKPPPKSTAKPRPPASRSPASPIMNSYFFPRKST